MIPRRLQDSRWCSPTKGDLICDHSTSCLEHWPSLWPPQAPTWLVAISSRLWPPPALVLLKVRLAARVIKYVSWQLSAYHITISTCLSDVGAPRSSKTVRTFQWNKKCWPRKREHCSPLSEPQVTTCLMTSNEMETVLYHVASWKCFNSCFESLVQINVVISTCKYVFFAMIGSRYRWPLGSDSYHCCFHCWHRQMHMSWTNAFLARVCYAIGEKKNEKEMYLNTIQPHKCKQASPCPQNTDAWQGVKSCAWSIAIID